MSRPSQSFQFHHPNYIYSCVTIKADRDHDHSAGNDLEGTVVSNLKLSIRRFGAESEQILGELSSQQRAVRQTP